MARRERRESGPTDYIISGLVLAALGGALGGAAGFDTTGGIIVAVFLGALGQICVGIGIVAKGVQVGNRASSD